MGCNAIGNNIERIEENQLQTQSLSRWNCNTLIYPIALLTTLGQDKSPPLSMLLLAQFGLEILDSVFYSQNFKILLCLIQFSIESKVKIIF